jgi:hypothetical protein
MSTQASPTRFATFAEFYPFYLGEHSNRTCRRLHFVGTSLGLGWWLAALLLTQPVYVLYGLLCGYGFAWIGHFGFENNKPASFKQPLFSFMGDWCMWWQMLTGKIRF